MKQPQGIEITMSFGKNLWTRYWIISGEEDCSSPDEGARRGSILGILAGYRENERPPIRKKIGAESVT